jgi:hypothetical protein
MQEASGKIVVKLHLRHWHFSFWIFIRPSFDHLMSHIFIIDKVILYVAAENQSFCTRDLQDPTWSIVQHFERRRWCCRKVENLDHRRHVAIWGTTQPKSETHPSNFSKGPYAGLDYNSPELGLVISCLLLAEAPTLSLLCKIID